MPQKQSVQDGVSQPVMATRSVIIVVKVSNIITTTTEKEERLKARVYIAEIRRRRVIRDVNRAAKNTIRT